MGSSGSILAAATGSSSAGRLVPPQFQQHFRMEEDEDEDEDEDEEDDDNNNNAPNLYGDDELGDELEDDTLEPEDVADEDDSMMSGGRGGMSGSSSFLDIAAVAGL